VVTSHPGLTRFAILLPLLHEPAGQPQASPVLPVLEPRCGRMRPKGTYRDKGEQ
jgi:hypothetical protein